MPNQHEINTLISSDHTQGARNKNNTHFAEIYPVDSSSETLPLIKDKDIWWKENNNGNDVIDATTVMHVGKIFTDALETKYKKWV